MGMGVFTNSLTVGLSWNNYEASLREMVVGGKRFNNAELTHDNEAGGIHERPILVGIALQHRPGFGILSRINMDDLELPNVFDLIHDLDNCGTVAT